MSYEQKWDDVEQANIYEKKDDKDGIRDLEPTMTNRPGSVFSVGSRGQRRRMSISDDVFGEISEDGPNYRDVGQPENRITGTRLIIDRLGGWEPLCS